MSPADCGRSTVQAERVASAKVQGGESQVSWGQGVADEVGKVTGQIIQGGPGKHCEALGFVLTEGENHGRILSRGVM